MSDTTDNSKTSEIFEQEAPPVSSKRERLLKNLEKGRKTALANRKKKAMYKRMIKKDKDDEMDKAIKAKLMERDDVDDLRRQLAEMKAMANSKKEAPQQAPQQAPVLEAPHQAPEPKQAPVPKQAPEPKAPEQAPVPEKQKAPEIPIVKSPPITLSTYGTTPW